MNATLQTWIDETCRRRGEDHLGPAFTSGLLEGLRLPVAAARRALASVIVGVVGERRASVSYDPDESFATLDPPHVNVDGSLMSAAEDGRPIEELVVGVAGHEGEHLAQSRVLGPRVGALQRFLYNLVEDERVEVSLAHRRPALAAPLATTRRELITIEPDRGGFLMALFALVRAPERMPETLWGAHERRLRLAMFILRPFPASADDVDRAVRRLMRLVPPAERRSVPPFPELRLRPTPGRRGTRGSTRRRPPEATALHPAVAWSDATPDAAGYASARSEALPETLALRTAFLAALRPRRTAAVRAGTLDRRRLHASGYDDRLFRAVRPAPAEIVVAVLLDLSGSMQASFPMLRRIAVAFSEAALGLRHVRLYVYGHAADGNRTTRTEITRFATPARGPVHALGTLPRGANNRDGHALEVIADDLARREPSRRHRRVAFHLCDGDPCAAGYRGMPAFDATRAGLAAFQRTWGPLILLADQLHGDLEALGAPVVTWGEAGFAQRLVRALAPRIATP